MTIYQILCLLGFPSLFLAVVGTVIAFIKSLKSLKLGTQALLRAQMISDYNKWYDKGYAPIWARENFENVWLNYHNLGANGVMDDIHNKFMSLPTEIQNGSN